MTLCCGQSSNLQYMVSLLDLLILFHRRTIYKMLAPNSPPKSGPLSTAGGGGRPTAPTYLATGLPEYVDIQYTLVLNI